MQPAPDPSLPFGASGRGRSGKSAGRDDGGQAELDLLLHQAGILAVPFDALQLHWALKGWRQFGKGRHQTGLNLGNCFSYGLAMTLNLPLLFKSEDFRSISAAYPSPCSEPAFSCLY